MTISEYLDECILILTVSSVVERFQVTRKEALETDGYLRVRAILVGEGLLEASMYCQRVGDNTHLAGYRFHWQDKEGNLIKRWDNAKHHPELKTFPNHVHLGKDIDVKESAPIDLQAVLQVLESELRMQEYNSTKSFPPKR
jgi:hypothetical protein